MITKRHGCYPTTKGLGVIVNNTLCVATELKQYRFPKSKKVRIRKKWKKRSTNYRPAVVHRMYVIGDKLIVSSLTLERLKLGCEKLDESLF